MSDYRFSSQTYNNSSFNRNRPDHNQSNRLEQMIPSTTEDWDNDLIGNQTKSMSFNRRDDPPVAYHSMTNTTPSNNNRNQGVSRDYLVHRTDVPRLIGKGGATIKQIQRDQNVQIQISNDREQEWVDVKISGSDEQMIEQTLNYILQNIGNLKEKTSVNNNNSFSSRWNNNNNDNNGRTNYESSNSSNSFNGYGRGNSGLSNNNHKFDQSQSSRSTFSKSDRRRCMPASAENDDQYDAFFGSDDEASTKQSVDDTQKIISAFAVAQPSSNSNNFDEIKRVDWAKMRRTDTSNDMSKWKDFPSVIKEFYHELPDIAEMSEVDVEALRAEKNNIFVSWFDPSMKNDYEQKNNCQLKIPNPIYEFAHAFHNYPEIMHEIAKQSFLEPSPIQCQAWPVALSGYDFIGIAQTGTGKTLAFLLPALIHIDNQPKIRMHINGPKALILSPTRELAIQIHQEVQKYNYRGIRSAVIYGGSSRKQQILQCETGVEIIIATPGRLNDLIMSNVIDVRSVTFLVLDEADRMLDMGFEPQIMKILLDIRPDRHTIMTSATWPEDVRRIAARYMRNPIQVYIGSLDLAAVHSVRQDIEIVKEEEKFDMLLDFIARMDADDKTIVFVDRKSSADSIASELIRKHISCQSIHGDREQSDREQALEDLKLGTVNILIATDVASRGLDIQDITVVFNYDLPKSMEDYVHRVGRTGRAGKTGYAISLVTRENWGSAGRLIKILEEAGQNVPGELREMAARFKEMQDRKRDFGGTRNRYGNRNDNNNGRFFGLGSIQSRGNDQYGGNREKTPVMNSGWSFSS